jgi:hypothetical protein
MVPAMTVEWDELTKSLAESVPRRESLRRFGALLAGAALGSLGLDSAWAGKADPCKSFCRCSKKAQQNQCLAACRACNGQTGRLAGTCGSHVCCPTAACRGVCSDLLSNPNCGACGQDCRTYGQTCCGGTCVDLLDDFDNCGACDARCDYPGPYEEGACVMGACIYACVAGALDCGGVCTPVYSDPHNCGACGNVCPASAPYCSDGTCADTYCNGADLLFDATNCGECGYQCQPLEFCSWGYCQGIDPGGY